MSYIITDQNVTLYHNAAPHVAPRSQFSDNEWAVLIEALNNADYDTALSLLDTATKIERFFEGDVDVQDGMLYYLGRPVDNYAAQKALEFIHQGLPYTPLLRFINRLMDNPSYRVVQRLYEFLEYGGLPLTEDGCFMAYKKVRRDGDRLVDIYTGRMDNSPGQVIAVPRNQVDEDQDRTCSHGLHVCSYEYLPCFGNGSWDVAVTVKVDPSDVVAIPRDYNNTKMRVCRYEVVEALPHYREDVLRDAGIWDDDDDIDEYDFDQPF